MEVTRRQETIWTVVAGSMGDVRELHPGPKSNKGVKIVINKASGKERTGLGNGLKTEK